jgi:predicted HTH transcriptional regulator
MKDKVFISSAQKELEAERLALLSLLTTDPFLKNHVEPVLFEQLPPPVRPKGKPYLDALKNCQIYVLMLDRDYADKKDIDVSPTREEYDLARSMGIPAMALVKGRYDDRRDPRTQAFFQQIKSDKFTYKRFTDRLDLKQEVSAWLLQVLKVERDIEPAPEDKESGAETIEATSAFESLQQSDVDAGALDQDVCKMLFKGLTGTDASTETVMLHAFRTRGLLWQDGGTGNLLPTAAGVVFLGSNPAEKYLQCQVLADVYPGTKVTAKPVGQTKLSGPIPKLIDELLDFVYKKTAHPTRVVGINNIALDEYPRKAVREALVNAFAHRDYADAGRKVRVEIFSDRLVVSSPGYPPKPLTLAKLRKGQYDSCRRNPVLAECLAALEMMEQRGSGFERIRAAMLDHGLDAHELDQRDGYFKVILPGPNGNYDRIRTPSDAQGLIAPSIESKLNERQKKIMVQVQTEGTVTTAWVIDQLGVVKDTAGRDFALMVELGLLDREGSGRGVHYVPARRLRESTDNRLTNGNK